jgi:hypothetical protein
MLVHLGQCFGGDRLIGIRHELLRQSDAAQPEADGLRHRAVGKRETLETPSAKIEDVEVAQRMERRIGREAAANEIGLFLAGKNPDRLARLEANALRKLAAVDGVADGACRDQDGFCRSKTSGIRQERANGFHAASDPVRREPWLRLADPGADPRVDGSNVPRSDAAIDASSRDENLDGIAANIDDGDRAGRHVATQHGWRANVKSGFWATAISWERGRLARNSELPAPPGQPPSQRFRPASVEARYKTKSSGAIKTTNSPLRLALARRSRTDSAVPTKNASCSFVTSLATQMMREGPSVVTISSTALSIRWQLSKRASV